LALLTPSLTVTDLSNFSGRAVSEYTAFASTAIAQASLLFQIASGLDSMPSDQPQLSTANNGILSMADALYLTQPYQAAINSPFQSESIGSYSYSKAQASVTAGIPTGVGWFDLAVQTLGDNTRKPSVSSEARTLFENDSVWYDTNGRLVVTGPSNFHQQDVPFSWSSDATFDPGNG